MNRHASILVGIVLALLSIPTMAAAAKHRRSRCNTNCSLISPNVVASGFVRGIIVAQALSDEPNETRLHGATLRRPEPGAPNGVYCVRLTANIPLSKTVVITSPGDPDYDDPAPRTHGATIPRWYLCVQHETAPTGRSRLGHT